LAHKVLVVIGTRPEAIKMAPVVAALRAYAPDVETRVALTGQHTTLVDQALEIFGIEPDYDLDIMQEGQSLYGVMYGALDGLKDVVRELEPDVVLVQGDTATVFAGALVGFFERVPVGHVEAGLRSHDKWAPFPEEILRRMTDVLADYCFAPTPWAASELLQENTRPDRVYVTGNTVVDALVSISDRRREIDDPALRTVVGDPTARLVLLTAHRRESFGEPLREVFAAVRDLVEEVDDVRVLYPVHPNPNVRAPAEELLSGHDRIHLTRPLDYLDLVAAMRHADLILTDSGGIQEEAPTFGTPVLVLRGVTERPEGIDAGVAELVGTDRARIVERAVARLAGGRPAEMANPYGDGRAGERIADIVVSSLTGRPRATEDWSP
jgi:UDP-N-acetylglucosamine 2-epimerase (non-hydrolysing)